MSQPRYQLPPSNSPVDVVRATDLIEAAGMSRRRALRVGWRYDLWYLKGLRNFRAIWATGEVEASHQTDRGILRMRYEDVLSKRQREIGRLMQSDLRPACRSKGVGIDSLRKASIGQVVLDYLEGNLDGERIKMRFIEDVVDFGTAALGIWVQPSVHLGKQPVIENIPPWELLPIPVEPSRQYDVKGICRDRWVSWPWLQTMDNLKFPKAAEEVQKLEIRKVHPGQKLPNDADPQPHHGGTTASTQSEREAVQKANSMEKDISTDWVYLREYWLEGEQGRVGRYIVKVGKWIALDEDLTSKKYEGADPPIMPIATARYYPTGFWGRSFVSPLIPINRKLEQMLANTFQNVIDLDLYGIKIIPTSAGIPRRALQNHGRMRYLFADPDYAMPQSKIYALEPKNMGDFPVKTIAFGNDLIDRISRESDMYSGQAPGRVDSSRALGLLYETSSIPLIPCVSEISSAYSQVYKAMLQEARKLLGAGEGQAVSIKLMTLDDAIAGVVIDPGTGEMKIDEESNGIPLPHEITVDVRERLPRFKAREEAQLQEAMQEGRLDPVDFMVEVLRKGIDVPLGNRGLAENIRSAWLENIVLFGDGKTPGEIPGNSYFDNHQVHKRILEDFVARPEIKMASEAVQKKLIAHLTFHTEQLGAWPEQVPRPEQLGAMPDELQGQLQSGAQQLQGLPQESTLAPA